MVRRRIVCSLLLAILAFPAHAAGRVKAIFPSGAEFDLEIADDPLTRMRGYMFRERVGPGQGMLFLFDESDRHGIWMKNCLVPLDVIWLDERLRVVEVARELQPCSDQGECPTASPMRPARYVLEVAGGTARREDLRLNDTIRVVGDSRLPEVP